MNKKVESQKPSTFLLPIFVKKIKNAKFNSRRLGK